MEEPDLRPRATLFIRKGMLYLRKGRVGRGKLLYSAPYPDEPEGQAKAMEMVDLIQKGLNLNIRITR